MMYHVPLLREETETMQNPDLNPEYTVDEPVSNSSSSPSSRLNNNNLETSLKLNNNNNNLSSIPLLERETGNHLHSLDCPFDSKMIGDSDIDQQGNCADKEGKNDSCDESSSSQGKNNTKTENSDSDSNNNGSQDNMRRSQSSPMVPEIDGFNKPQTRRVSLPGKHLFTVTNYGEKNPKHVELIREQSQEDPAAPVNQLVKDIDKTENNNNHSSDGYDNFRDSDKKQVQSKTKKNDDIPHIMVTLDAPALTHNINQCNKATLQVPRPGSQLKKQLSMNCDTRLEPSSFKRGATAGIDNYNLTISYTDEHPIRNSYRNLWKKSANRGPLTLPDTCSIHSTNSLAEGKASPIKRHLSMIDFASAISSPIRDVIKKGRVFAKRKQDRLILKNGAINLARVQVEKRKMRFFHDLFTTLVDVKWRYMILLLASAFIVTWIGFGLIWWAIYAYQVKHGGPECMTLVDNFESALLFSIETQHTIGYGSRAVTKDCRIAIFFVMLQSLIGITISCVTTGLVFAKFSRPRRKAETLMFSKNAVIHEKDKDRYLSFRVGDIRQNHMIQVTIQAVMFSHNMTVDLEDLEGVPFQQHNLHVVSEAGNCFFLAWPVEISHKIDETSPLWEISEEDLLDCDFEIVVILEGLITSTGQTTQICTSYLPSEVLWAEKLNPLITGRKQSGKYLINYKNFHSTSTVKMSALSGMEEATRRNGLH